MEPLSRTSLGQRYALQGLYEREIAATSSARRRTLDQALAFSRSAYFLRIFCALGATTNMQYGCVGLFSR